MHSQTFVGVKNLHACLWHFPGVKLATQGKKVCPDTASVMPAYCYLAQSEGCIHTASVMPAYCYLAQSEGYIQSKANVGCNVEKKADEKGEVFD